MKNRPEEYSGEKEEKNYVMLYFGIGQLSI